ncbi:MAG: hypothetical protein ACXWUX_10275 [Allosphingosinicella sp.]
MRKIAAPALLLILGLYGCATQSEPTASQQADRWALDNARETGPAEDCVQLIRIRETRVRDEQTVDFIMNDGTVMRNRLPYSCPGLRFEERFSYATSLSRLCSVDTITVLTSSGMRGASCGLGRFQPVEIAQR